MSENKNDNNDNQKFSIQNIIQSETISNETPPEQLDQIISRLEKAIEKVELLSSLNEDDANNIGEIKIPSPSTIFWNNCLKLLEDLKEKSLQANNVHFEELTEIFIESICFQQDILLSSLYFKKPTKEEMKKLLSILQNQIKKLEKILIFEPNLSLQIELVQKGMNSLSWMFETFKCKLIVNNSYKILTEISKKIIQKGNKIYVGWTNIFLQLMNEIVKFVNNYHENGLNWFTQGNNNVYELILEIGNTYKKYFKNYSKIFQDESSLNQIEENNKMYGLYEGVMSGVKEKEMRSKKSGNTDKNDENNNKNEISLNDKMNNINNNNDLYSNNDINNNIPSTPNIPSNANIFDNIQSIYDKFMEIKNASKEMSKENLRSNSISHQDCLSSLSCSNSIKDTQSDSWPKMGVRKRVLSMGERNFYQERENVILYQNFDGIIKNIKSDSVDEHTALYIINCLNSSFKVTKTINRIIILNCQNCKVICGELMANIEIVNNTKIIMQCDGDAKMANIEGSKDIMLILSPESRNIPIHYGKSTYIRVRILKGDNNCEKTKDFDEYVLPEQFDFSLNKDDKFDYSAVSI